MRTGADMSGLDHAICSNCGTENRPGRKFCSECAAPLAVVCPACGASNEPGEKFCGECAAPLTDTAGVASPGPTSWPVTLTAAPVAERRLVTVLFADIVGFTPFAEERDAEEVRDTLSRYFELCADVIGRYGGTIEKYIGDAVMAVWGAPTAHEDDAERAVRAALELVAAVPGLGPGAQARAGVLTGEAAVTLGAINQGMVAGDLVNTAARLQSVAPPGTVLVGEATFRAAAGAIAFEEAGGQVLKGKQAPVAAWRAVRVVAQRGGRNRSETLEAPFVGRADELRLLKELFHATGREQKVRLVSVMGPAGIGKSRLAWEFLKYVDGLVETTYWHSGRCPAYGEGITFWALGEMVRGRCGLLEGDDEETTRRKVGETVAQWVSDESERAWVEPALLTLLGIESGMGSEQLFGAWRTFLERIAGAGTVTLVFEDMQFADSGLLDFIDHLLDWSRGYPIYIVTLARPELLDRRPDWGAGKRSFTSIYLEPLGEPDMRALLAGLVPGLPEVTVKAIVGRADGVALYAVETVRMLVNDRRLKEEQGIYVPVGDLTSLAVPETLIALIAARLDSLETTDRSLIHDAAVLGQSFTVAGLAAVSSIAQAELEPRLNALVRREILVREIDQRSAEQGQYAFVQSLTREVAYNTLSKKDRKVRHLAAARYFEQLGSDELASALAGHYLAAHENAAAGAEADALAALARVALRAAAERAIALGAHDQAVAFFNQALSVTTDPSDEADLLERAAKSAGFAARYDAGIDLARRALELRIGLGDRLGAARALGLQGELLDYSAAPWAARELLEQAVEKYMDLWPDPVIAELKVHLADAVSSFGDNTRAIALCDEALAVAEHGNHRVLLARALIYKGTAMGEIGRLHEAIGLIRIGEEVAEETGDNELVLAGLGGRGFHLGEVDNVAAMQCFRDGLALSRRIGHRRMMQLFINCLGYSGFLIGDWDAALAEMDGALAEDIDPARRTWILSNELIIRASRGESVTEGIAELDRLVALEHDPLTATAPLDTKAFAALAEGRFDDAQRYWVDTAEAWPRQAPECYYKAGRAALWARDRDALLRCRDGLDATGFHGPVAEARRMTLNAGVAALEGREREALAGYLEALRAWRDLRIAWEEALTGLDMATVLDPELPEVRAIVRTTREILERLRARPYLERLDAAMARGTAGHVAHNGAAVGVRTSAPTVSGGK
ncbi:MAG TPA: adenylate/guanylate cyclase domain-containing protein [Candidatus Limnocylindrales bacterium]